MSIILRRIQLARLRMQSSRRTGGTKIGYQIDLIRHLVWRDFSLRYKQSVLGIVWSLLLPMIQLMVFVLVFQVVVPLNIEAYPAYVFSALLPWTWFSNSVSTASGLFISNRDLLRHPNFRPATLVLVNALSNLIAYLAALPVLLALLIGHQLYPQPILLIMPLLMLIQTGLIVGLSLIVATLNVFFRDIQHITGVVLGLLFYITPVFYRPTSTNERFHTLFALNPMKPLVEGYRAVLYGQAPDWTGVMAAGVLSAVLCVAGYIVYASQQHNMFDNI